MSKSTPGTHEYNESETSNRHENVIGLDNVGDYSNLQLIHNGKNSLIYRAKSERDNGETVILKTCSPQLHGSIASSNYRTIREFKMGSKITVPKDDPLLTSQPLKNKDNGAPSPTRALTPTSCYSSTPATDHVIQYKRIEASSGLYVSQVNSSLIDTPTASPLMVNMFRFERDTAPSLTIPPLIKVELDAQQVQQPFQELDQESNKPQQRRMYMVLEDFKNSLTLRQYMLDQGIPSVNMFLRLSIQLVNGLSAIHRQGIIHCNLSAENVLIDVESGMVKIIDFRLARTISGGATVATADNMNHYLSSPSSLQCLAPEQSGRMNQSIDERSDLYSLGALFYLMLCGRPPMLSDENDPLSTIYFHLAVAPTPPTQINPNIPENLSQLVLKLLSKNSADRYNSTYGLKYDLNQMCALTGESHDERALQSGAQCLITLHHHHGHHRSHSDESCIPFLQFKIGSKDIRDHYHPVSSLYGRQESIESLLSVFSKVAKGFKPNALVLVCGNSGMGKSSLVMEIHKPLLKQRGCFVSGKLEEFKSVPLYPFIQIFKQLVQSLLMLSDDGLNHWRQKITESLKHRIHVMIDIVPELEQIVGSHQPIATDLSATENETRFLRTCLDFISLFASEMRPLVCFIDDLQWSDLVTINLIRTILQDPNCRFILLIGAYRDEVKNDTLHRNLLNEQSLELRITRVELPPLSIDSIAHLLSDTFCSNRVKVQSLAELIHMKSNGNCYFVHTIISELVRNQSIFFDYKREKWVWDIDSIRKEPISTEIVALLENRIQSLPDETRKLLSEAAVIGHNFSVLLLATIDSSSIEQTEELLLPALEEGLIMNKSESEIEEIEHTFVHDHVHRILYEMIDDERIEEIHFRVALYLRQMNDDRDEILFEVADHYVKAISLIRSYDHHAVLDIAHFLLHAASKAKRSSACSNCLRICKAIVQLIDAKNSMWEEHYHMALNVHRLMMESEYCRKNFSNSEQIYTYALEHCTSDLDILSLHMVRMKVLETAGQFQEMASLYDDCLQMLGIELPETTQELSTILKEELGNVFSYLSGREVEDIIHAPEIVDEKILTKLSLLTRGWPLFIFLGKHLKLKILVCMAANLCLLHGNCSTSSLVYVFFARVLSCETKDYVTAGRFGSLSIRLCDKYPDDFIPKRVYLAYGGTCVCWLQSFHTSIKYMDLAAEIASAQGDYTFSAYTSISRLFFGLYSGQDLDSLYRFYHGMMDWLKRENYFMYLTGMGFMALVRYLLGLPETLEKEKYDFLPITKICHHIGVVCSSYLSGDFAKAMDNADVLFSDLAGASEIYYLLFEGRVYASLLYIKVCGSDYIPLTDHQKELLMNRVDRLISHLEILCENCEENFLPRLKLLQAEKCRYDGNNVYLAAKLYEEAGEAAQQAGQLQMEALVKELAAEYWIEQNIYRFAKLNLKEAISLWRKYGSSVRAKYLESKFRAILSRYRSGSFSLDSKTFSIFDNQANLVPELSFAASAIDLVTVMKATRAVSSESRSLDAYLNNMTKIIIENSGAHKGVIIRCEPNGGLLVMAEGTMNSMNNDSMRVISLDQFSMCAKSVVYYVARTKNHIEIGDFNQQEHQQFAVDPYVHTYGIKSVLCVPILRPYSSDLMGILYLDNDMANYAFSNDRVQVLELLASQLLLHLENSKFSEDLRIEKKYREIAAELKSRKQKLEEFVDVLCHELRNPLNAIYGNTNILKEVLNPHVSEQLNSQDRVSIEYGEIQELMESIESISCSANHLKDIVDTVLNISALENQSNILHSVTFKPDQVIALTSSMFKAQIQEKKLRLILKHNPENDLKVKGDAYRFKEIIINLLSNAIKFTQYGSIVICSSCNRTTNDPSRVEWTVEVSDTGIGLSEIEHRRMFKAFSQASEEIYDKYGGTGLGLKICKDLVELLGGKISVESEKGKGSTFKFSAIFDLVEENPEVASSASPQPRIQSPVPMPDHLPSEPNKILIVDDNQINAKLLCKILNNAGYECEVASDGIDAVALCKENRYSVILMDILMPICDGLEATKKIRNYEMLHGHPRVPIVGVSANARDESTKKAIEAGMDDYLTKPYKKRDVIQTAEKWIQKRVNSNTE